MDRLMDEDLTTVTGDVHRHQEYYFDDGNLVIRVENTLFKVFRSTFIRHSPVFKDLFSLPEPMGAAEGSSDENPVHFSGISATDFERFLWVLYPPSYGESTAKSLPEWTSILDLATRWDFASIRTLAIRSIQSLPDISPVDRVVLSRDYEITGRWTIAAYTALCERVEPLSIEEATPLGLETSIRIAQLRERFRGTSRETTGYHSSTRASTARRTGEPTATQMRGSRTQSQGQRPQWDVGRSFFDQGDIPPPVYSRPPPPSQPPVKKAHGGHKSAPLSRTARLVAEAFGLEIPSPTSNVRQPTPSPRYQY